MSGRHPVILKYIQTTRGEVEYNVYDFLKEMEKKPIIWNKMHIDHRNNAIFNKNWNLFGAALIPFFDTLDDDEKEDIINELKSYWFTLKNNIMKAICKRQKGQPLHCHILRYMEFFLKLKSKRLEDIATEEELKVIDDNEINLRARFGLPPPESANNKRPRQNNDNVGKDPSISKVDKQPKSKKIKAEISLTTHSPGLSTKHTMNEAATNGILGEIAEGYTKISEQTSNQHMIEVNSFGDEVHKETQFDYRQQQLSTRNRIEKFANGTGLENMEHKPNDAFQTFFESIKPSLRKLNDFQNIDFKIEVLKAIRKCNLY